MQPDQPNTVIGRVIFVNFLKKYSYFAFFTRENCNKNVNAVAEFLWESSRKLLL